MDNTVNKVAEELIQERSRVLYMFSTDQKVFRKGAREALTNPEIFNAAGLVTEKECIDRTNAVEKERSRWESDAKKWKTQYENLTKEWGNDSPF